MNTCIKMYASVAMLLLAVQIASAQVYLVTETVDQLWQASAWVNDQRTVYTYDANNQAVDMTTQIWQSNAWVNSSRTLYTYTASGYETTNQNWSGAWVNQSKITYVLDASKRITEMTIQTWTAGAWVNQMKMTYTYNANGTVKEITGQMWVGGIWMSMSKTVYTYNPDGTLSEALSQTWAGTSWINSARTTYTYSGGHNILTLTQTWQGSWVNNSQTQYTYVGDLLTEFVSQNWSGSAWVNVTRMANTYNAKRLLSETLMQNWQVDKWVNSRKNTSQYDANDNTTEVVTQEWVGSAWVNKSKTTYSYKRVTQVNDNIEPTTFDLLQNYPNPFNPSTTIEFTLPVGGFTTLKVHDILGREVGKLVSKDLEAGRHIVTFNAASLPSGVYYYTLRSGKYISTKSLLLTK